MACVCVQSSQANCCCSNRSCAPHKPRPPVARSVPRIIILFSLHHRHRAFPHISPLSLIRHANIYVFIVLRAGSIDGTVYYIRLLMLLLMTMDRGASVLQKEHPIVVHPRCTASGMRRFRRNVLPFTTTQCHSV